MLNEKGNIKIKQDIVLREEEEGSFLFDPNTGRICFLNEIPIILQSFRFILLSPIFFIL